MGCNSRITDEDQFLVLRERDQLFVYSIEITSEEIIPDWNVLAAIDRRVGIVVFGSNIDDVNVVHSLFEFFDCDFRHSSSDRTVDTRSGLPVLLTCYPCIVTIQRRNRDQDMEKY